jgi:hypothetical protein
MIKPKALEDGLLYLHKEKGLAWTTASTKVKQAMQEVLKYGRKEEFLPADFDPFRDIDCEASSDYEAITCTPEQTLEILNQMDEPEFILTLVIAATGLSISEALGSTVGRRRVRPEPDHGSAKPGGRDRQLQERFIAKLRSPCIPVLGAYLNHWHVETMYARPTNWVFASTKLKGAKPRALDQQASEIDVPSLGNAELRVMLARLAASRS